jgi:hypothetical protein
MEIVGIFYDHLEYFTVILYISWPFGKVGVIWYIFPRFGTLYQEKSGNPASHQAHSSSTFFTFPFWNIFSAR